jgi:hypothetical protein
MSESGDQQQRAPTLPRWVHTLNGPWSTETYGIVEFLRVHPAWRRTVAVLGILLCVGAVASFAGLKIPNLRFSFLPCFIVGPWLLYIATISGSQFEVVFPQRQAAEERKEAEKKYEQSKTVEDALRLDFTRLNEYYVINQGQARSSFRWAVFSMLLGFGTIICGIWFFYLRTSQPDVFMASMSTAAGIVVNIISASFLYLHSKTQDRSLHYYQQLVGLQKLALAIRLCGTHEEPDARHEARNLVISALISQSTSQKSDSGTSINPA